MGRHGHARARLAAVGMVTALAVGGCTSGADISGATLAPLSSSASQTSAADPTNSTQASAGPSSALDTTPASIADASTETTASPIAEPPWAALDLTDAQVADAEAAVAAYRGYSNAVDQSATDPTKDWSALIRTFATDPAASDWLEFLTRPAVQLGRGSGATLIDPTVTAVEPALVTISDCIDTTQITFTGADGKSLIAPDQQGTYRRHPATVQVGQFENGTWLVTYITDDYQVRC